MKYAKYIKMCQTHKRLNKKPKGGKKMKKRLLTALLTGAMVMGMTMGSVHAEEATSDHSDQLYIQVAALSNLPYFADHMLGMETVGKELGVQTEYVGPADYDLDAMIEAFQTAIAKKPNGIVVVGFDDSLGAMVDQAWDAGIPCVVVDGDINNCKKLAFVGTGNVAAGEQGGQYVADALDGKGKVAILTKPGQGNLEQRIEGYMNVFDQYPDIEVVQTGDTQSDSTVAAQVTATILQQYPDLDCIVCAEAAGGSGAATAVKEAGKEGQVTIICFDRDDEVVQSIEDGVITASLVQQTALMPYYAVEILMAYNNSNIEITSDNEAAGLTGTPVSIDTGSVIMDINNVEYFKR